MGSRNLKKFGLKATLPRLKVLHLLETSQQRHLTAEGVYKSLLDMGEDIGLATVYRVLTQFESAGLVIRHYFEGGSSVFELDKGHHHDHLVCVKCGRVEEFIDDNIEKRQHAIAQQKGFLMTGHNLYLYGVCRHCQSLERLSTKIEH
ncbi:MAG: ferric iron uptake transcriptional regulator [Beggiatoa sp. IS2]|nr:MAG: ferric iron uptake transcriptional regulator [Beggiatoa sp. IS2]